VIRGPKLLDILNLRIRQGRIPLEEQELRIFETIEESRDQMIRHLQELVRVDTQTPPGHDYDKVCGLMAEKLGGLGCDVAVHEATEKYMKLSGARLMGLEGPRSNVVARLKGSGRGPTLHISAHIDTAAI